MYKREADRYHSAAILVQKQQSGGVYSFLLPAHNLSSRSGRADFLRFSADFSQKAMIFFAAESVVTESTICINLSFVQYGTPFFLEGVCLPSSSRNSARLRVGGMFVWFLPWPIRYNLILWACGWLPAALVQREASTFGEPGFHIIPMKVIVNISYCAKAEVGKHVTCGCLTLWKLMATHRPWQVKGCDSALDLQFFHGSLVSLADQVPMSRMWRTLKLTFEVMTSVCHLLSNPPTRWSAWSSKWCWWNLFPFQSR